MALLVLGLILFLGVHSTRIVADGWRGAMLGRWGERGWKGLYSVVSLVGFVLLCWGYARARQAPVALWTPPRGMNHLAALLMLVAFVLLVAAYVPRNAIKARLHHPMILAVKTWAVAHLLANGTLADVLLFGAFLLWAVFDFRSARQRDRVMGTTYPPGTVRGTTVTVIVGLVAYAVFLVWGHRWLIGVSPLGI
jgi:uncharacterized membrane protein